MAEYPHFILGDRIAPRTGSFQPKSTPIGNNPLPIRDRHEHYSLLSEAYANAVTTGIEQLTLFNQENRISADGVYLDVNLAVGVESLESLDSKSAVRLMNVSSVENEEGQNHSTKATVYLPISKRRWLNDKLDKYNDPTKDTSKGNPRGASLIDDINSIQRASLESFFINRAEYTQIGSTEKNWYEIWVDNSSEGIIQDTYNKINNLDIEISDKYITFKLVVVFLIHANLNELEKLPQALNYLSEIRLFKQPSILLTGNPIEHQEWTDLLSMSIKDNSDENSPVIGIIDTGVNNEHRLIKPFLSDDNIGCLLQNTDSTDQDGHGTGMSGICLFGDMTNLIYQRGADIPINHRLASVKMYSKYSTEADAKELYGVRTENAVEMLEEMNASIFCMAITENDENCSGVPSSWSADIDKILYHGGRCDRIMLISAGNISNLEDLTQENYRDNCIKHKAQSPSQSLNAITIGAYTEKVMDSQYGNEGEPIAPCGEISPYSRTSCEWDSKRNKPDIVMEGGNVLKHDRFGAYITTDLNLITTSNDLRASFQIFNATSAATALASKLVARIKATYPQLSALALRALLVHSAEWNENMKAIDKANRMSMYGYGVPSEDRALNSNNYYATYIFENAITPYDSGSGDSLKYAGFQLYDLPWPIDLLQDMGGEQVTLKITLSYYIDPAPGEKGRLNRYRYHNALLNFDLKAPTESIEGFIARNNKLEESPSIPSQRTSSRWAVGVKKRKMETVQSDWIECTAAELADCGQIMIYPGAGWWKEQKLNHIDNRIKYALIVSIQTKETPIYTAVQQAIANRIRTQIQV
jgi:hypothetical protein